MDESILEQIPAPEFEGLLPSDRALLKAILGKAIVELPPLEGAVLTLAFFSPLSFSGIGALLDVDTAEVYRLKHRAIRRIRTHYGDDLRRMFASDYDEDDQQCPPTLCGS